MGDFSETIVCLKPGELETNKYEKEARRLFNMSRLDYIKEATANNISVTSLCILL
jgi:hypothetical protein